MKKTIAFFAAVTLLAGLCSCEDKPDVSEPDGEVTTAVTEEATEPLYLELTEADFEPVDIRYEVIEGEPPAGLHSADLSGIDFGERLSPCKAPEVRDSYGNRSYIDDADPEWVKSRDETLQKIADTPCKGFVDRSVLIGGTYYLAMNYDDLCGSHDSSLYAYDIASGECRELVTHTGLDYNGCFYCLIDSGGKPTYVDYRTDTENGGMKSVVLSVDPDSGSEHEICETSGLVWGMKPSEKGLLLYKNEGTPVADETEGYDLSQEVVNTVVEYDLEKGEFGAAEVNKAGVPGVLSAECDGVPAEITGGFDGEKYSPITVKTQYYTISTDINYATSIFTWRDKLCIISIEGVSGSWMYTYDITNRERLKMKFEGYGGADIQQTNDGLLAFVRSNDYGGSADSNATRQHVIKLYYIIPTLAVEYRFGECDDYLQTDLSTAADKPAYILTLKSLGNEFRASGIYVGYDPTNRNVPDKLYWFDTE